MKGEIFTDYNKLKHKQELLNNQIISIKKQLQKLPSGKLICAKNGKYYKWYQSDGHTKTLIPKRNRKLAEALAAKKYLTLQLQELEHRMKIINLELHGNKIRKISEQLLTESPEYQRLLLPYFSSVSTELSTWQNTSYETNSYHSEQLIHKCVSGNIVRSKSEVMIDMVLCKYQIPFRYESALHLGEATVFPDFTIRHPKTGEYFYWEHFGLMDNTEYVNNSLKKLQMYITYGIIPSVQLITTYETKEHPLEYEMIERIVEQYFL